MGDAINTAGVNARFNWGDYFPLRVTRRYFPGRDSNRISLKTLYRWATRGVRGAKLRTIRLGHQVCTCDAWVREFIEQLNAGRPEVLPGEQPTDREVARRQQVDEALNEAGL